MAEWLAWEHCYFCFSLYQWRKKNTHRLVVTDTKNSNNIPRTISCECWQILSEGVECQRGCLSTNALWLAGALPSIHQLIRNWNLNSYFYTWKTIKNVTWNIHIVKKGVYDLKRLQWEWFYLHFLKSLKVVLSPMSPVSETVHVPRF